jgi:hypothetical protein
VPCEREGDWFAMRQVMENCKVSAVGIFELSFGFNLQLDFSAHTCELHFYATAALYIRSISSKHRLAV